MKAAILTKLNAPLELWEVEHRSTDYEKTCASGQVRVEMLASGICGSQLAEIRGDKQNERFIPHAMGHEGCGIVREVGAGVSVQLRGKKVVLHWRKGDGPEAFLTSSYFTKEGKTAGCGHVVTLAESVVVSANRVTPVDDAVPPQLCALLGCGLSTALGTIEQEAKLRMGESILIIGCGGVGLNLIQAARLAQAYPIVACDISEDKKAAAMALGSHQFFNRSLASLSERFDVIVDTSGSIQALESAIPLLSGRGRFIMVGHPKPGEAFKIQAASEMFYGEGHMIKATQGGGFRPSLDIPRYVNLWRDGKLDIGSIVSHQMPLADVNRGIDLVRAGQAGRVMIFMK